jgi:hypothetical protein
VEASTCWHGYNATGMGVGQLFPVVGGAGPEAERESFPNFCYCRVYGCCSLVGEAAVESFLDF